MSTTTSAPSSSSSCCSTSSSTSSTTSSSSSPKPHSNSNLQVTPLLPSEAHLYQAIRHETFRPTINKILYAREPSQETQNHVIRKTRQDLEENGVLFMVCRDMAADGAIIAGARWRYLGPKHEDDERTPPGPRSREDVEADLSIPAPYPESNPAAFNALFHVFHDAKRDIMGNRPYYALDTLVTHPDHHRRGAGGRLVAWGCEQADRRGVECYLEASPMGKPLYERFGFREVRTVSVDLRALGAGEEKFDFILMRRPPQGERQE